MKIILSHNFYKSSSPSGEDEVYRNEVALLKRQGIDVITYEFFNDAITWKSSVKTALKTVWATTSYQELSALIRKENPDIVHFHNIWYLISPSAYYACADEKVPVVQTLHNFRIACANGLLLRNGKVCEACLGKLPWRSVVYGCYRDSRIFSLPVAAAEAFHSLKGTWTNTVDAYITLTEFGKKKAAECGLPKEKLFVKPNFLENPPEPSYSGAYALFLGRLSNEKGITVLLDACKCLTGKVSFKIVGEGPLMSRLQGLHSPFIDFTGRKSFDECISLLKGSLFLVMPSIWYEGFPMVIREAFACGKPVIASNLGSLASIVEHGKTGLLFEPGNAEDLASKIKWMIENKDACIQMGKNARAEFEAKYTAEKNFEILMGIYEKVLSNKKN
jgi:glycosyltransferase involved in cell wall biosynthesis